ncbi:MAG: low molecular weight phosphotyrosine protein phosphatase [Phycisphaerae bacterium]|nr:low molecular weight phosphotyrosine protein phosphatase [Phycisphaerae bacterium]
MTALEPQLDTPAQVGVLFVCLGNICRSPLAEGIFLDAARKRQVAGRFRVDSCGLGAWHAGELPDERARLEASRHGLTLTHRARQVRAPHDFLEFRWILAMDRSNAARLTNLGAPASRLRLMRSFDPTLPVSERFDAEVPDPYTGGERDFQEVFGLLRSACEGLLDHLIRCPE